MLDGDAIEAIAMRVVELLHDLPEAHLRYVDAATVAEMLCVDRDWVYAHARDLGAVRLGSGSKARVRFDPSRVGARLATLDTSDQPPPNEPRRQRRRSRERSLPTGLKLIQGRSSR